MAHKTKATGGGRQWENTKHKPEHHSDLLAGGQSVRFAPMTLGLTEGHYGEYAGLLVGYSCSLASPCCDVFQVCDPIFVRLYSLRNCSRAKAHGANLSDSCSIFLRRLFRAGDGVLVDSLLVILCTCKAMRRSSSHHGDDSYYSDSLALRRWRRLISPSNAAVTNCPVLSPSSLTLSIASTIWSGTRASILFDFAFTDFVAISDFRLVWCPTMIAIKKVNAMLDVSHTIKIICVRHLIFISNETTKPRTVGAVTGLLTTNDSRSIEVAMRNHTTHPQGRDSHNLNKYIWRFIALSTAQPRVIHIVATSEQEARQQSPAGCVMVFAARIRQGVCHA
ncbi:TPA: host cell division inhibitor Icd-like protein [Escherichia coli]|nr:host cell division inhibitor Icd-like protein [Escherichia coli]